MNTHNQIIELWPSRAAFARDMGLEYVTAATWYRRNSIPPAHWTSVVKAARDRGFEQITTDLLAQIKAGERSHASA